jgi:3-oxoacyl-[acyl-carrier-protein] synthase-3
MRFSIVGIEYQLGEIEIDLLRDHPVYASVLTKTGMPRHYQSELPLHKLAAKAASKLLSTHTSEAAQIGALLLVTQSSEFHLPSTSALVHEALGLAPEVMAIDLNQGCSGFVQALCIAVPLTASHGNVLIVCADRYRAKLRTGDRSTESIFSDAASAVLVGRDGPLTLGFQSHHTEGSGAHLLQQRMGGTLTMSGAEVFLWTRNRVAKQIRAALEAELTLGHRIGTVVLHQASKLVVETIQSALPKETRVPTNFEVVGNTVSSSIPILLAQETAILKQSGSTLLSGFGVGLSSSVMVIHHG